MFGEALRAARVEAAMSVSELAERSATSRSAIADYESGRKNPRTDTAERILNALGATLAVARAPHFPARRAVFDRDDARRLERLRGDRAGAVAEARRLIPDIIESDCAVEGITVDWGDAKALSDGISIGGPPLEVWRATEIARSIRAGVKRAHTGLPYPLRSVVRETLIQADEDAPEGLRQLEYLVNIIAAGGDPTLMLHAVSTSLVQNGYPWLFCAYGLVEQYQRALVAAKRTADGTELVRILIDSAERRQEW